jgi:hypothetical protein
MIADVVWVHNFGHRLLCQFEFDERSGFHGARERVTTLAPACWAPKHHLDVLADLAHGSDERLGHGSRKADDLARDGETGAETNDQCECAGMGAACLL